MASPAPRRQPSVGLARGASTLGIWRVGPHIAHGYRQRPDAFLHTGDLGFVRDGQMFVAVRLEDMRIVRRVNDDPQDIAAAASEPSGAAAFAFEDGTRECVVVMAEVKRSAMRSLDRRRLVAKVRERVLDRHEHALADLVLIRQGSLPGTSAARCNAVGHGNSIWLASSWCSMRPNPASRHERSPACTVARS